ncbi:MAG: YidB family protein [Chlorobiales bacterium]|nr:YidB family protein [Chlorobiales bacterium]
MDIAKILQLGASLIQQNSDEATTNLGTDELKSAISNLFGGEEGKLDFGSLLSKMHAGGLGHSAASWLGTGENAAISPDTITELLGSDKIKAFASQLGLSEESAKSAIADALPEMVHKASPEGSLIENLFEKAGGIKGLTDIASKFF